MFVLASLTIFSCCFRWFWRKRFPDEQHNPKLNSVWSHIYSNSTMDDTGLLYLVFISVAINQNKCQHGNGIYNRRPKTRISSSPPYHVSCIISNMNTKQLYPIHTHIWKSSGVCLYDAVESNNNSSKTYYSKSGIKTHLDFGKLYLKLELVIKSEMYLLHFQEHHQLVPARRSLLLYFAPHRTDVVAKSFDLFCGYRFFSTSLRALFRIKFL